MSWQACCKFIFCFSQNVVSKRNTASNILLRLSTECALTSKQILWARVFEKLKQQTWCWCIWQIQHLEKISCLSSFDSWTGHPSCLASCTPSVLLHQHSPTSACRRPQYAAGLSSLRCSWHLCDPGNTEGMKEPQGTCRHPSTQSSRQALELHQSSVSMPLY